MRYRRLGRTGLDVSELTFGTAGLEGSDVKEASSALEQALQAGINALELRGGGRAAILVGLALKDQSAGHRVHVFSRLSSLVAFDLPSPHVHAQQAYPGRHIRAETEALLKTLGAERLAVQQLHAWCPEWLHEGDWLETLQRLREEGKIGAVGISLFDHDVDSAREAVASGAIDCVQVMYNVFDQGPASVLFPLCSKHDVGVIARSPLYYGALTSRLDSDIPFTPDDWRRDYFFEDHLQETRARVHQVRQEAEEPDPSLAELALRFSLSNGAVSTVAVGMRDARQVKENVRALERGSLGAEKLAKIERHKWLC